VVTFWSRTPHNGPALAGRTGLVLVEMPRPRHWPDAPELDTTSEIVVTRKESGFSPSRPTEKSQFNPTVCAEV